MPQSHTILVVDDEENARKSISAVLRREGYRVQAAASAAEAIELAGAEAPDLLVTDVVMPEMDGLTMYERLRARHPDLLAIVVTGHESVESAVRAMRLGAYDYITKPFQPAHMLATIARALDHSKVVRENKELRFELEARYGYENIVGSSEPMQRVYEVIEKVATSDATVLLRGESGTGKELFARAIHYHSPRAEARFVVAACAALPETLMESELFGHEKGAFTGAIARKKGLFELADGGTLFLDEIGDIILPVQSKLLRVLQEREFTRVGGTEPLHCDVRIISATHRNLEELVEKREFREDLYYRVNVIQIDLPALRDRKEDVPLLVKHFLQKFSGDAKQLSDEAMQVLCRYSWPGNVRELENVMERAVTLAEGTVITPEALPRRVVEMLPVEETRSADPLDYQAAKEGFERGYLRRLLAVCNGNITVAAKKAGISRRHFYEKLRQLNIDPADSRGAGS